MDKLFILFLVIFLFNTPIIPLITNIAKYGLYLIILLACTGYLNADITKQIKNYLIGFINFDGSILSNILSKIALFINSILGNTYTSSQSEPAQIYENIQNVPILTYDDIQSALTYENSQNVPNQIYVSSQPNQIYTSNQPNKIYTSSQPNKIYMSSQPNKILKK
jgi:hypothetical protein